MLFKQVALILALSIYVKHTKSYDLDRCSVGYQKLDGMWMNMNLTELESNAPKKNEILRTKAYIKGKFPAFRVTNNENEINFGKTRDNVWRIIHFPVDKFESFDEPCFLPLDKMGFSDSDFNEIHLVLKKDGLFSVTVSNDRMTTAFSCPPITLTYDVKKPTEVGFVSEHGKKTFLYDC